MAAEESPTRRQLLGTMAERCTYLVGELSEQDPEFDAELRALGVSQAVVPDTGHAMGLQNPEGFASAVADVLAST